MSHDSHTHSLSSTGVGIEEDIDVAMNGEPEAEGQGAMDRQVSYALVFCGLFEERCFMAFYFKMPIPDFDECCTTPRVYFHSGFTTTTINTTTTTTTTTMDGN